MRLARGCVAVLVAAWIASAGLGGAAWSQAPSDPSAPFEGASGPSVDMRLVDPGVAPVLERDRRLAPQGRAALLIFGGALGLALLFAWAMDRRGHLGLRRLALILALLAFLGASAEAVLPVAQDGWALHVRMPDGVYPTNPRGYFEPCSTEAHQGAPAFCVDRVDDVWAACEDAEARAPDPETWTVMALGGAFTDGTGVFTGDAWPSALGRDLEALEGRRTQARVVNCGKAGSRASAIAARYLAQHERHTPDVVVVSVTLDSADVPADAALPGDALLTNVSFQIPTREAYSRLITEDDLWTTLVQGSALARLMVERVTTRQVAVDTLDRYRAIWATSEEPWIEGFSANIEAVKDAVEAQGGHVLVVLWPLLVALDDYPFWEVHGRIARILGERGVEVLDLLPTFADRAPAELRVHVVDWRPNEVAHALAAKAIGAELERRRWSDRPSTP